MKILWVSNSPIGPAEKILNEDYKGTSGGWIQSEYEYLDKTDVEMSFLCFAPNVKKGELLVKSNEVGTLYALKAPRFQMGVAPSKSIQSLVQRAIDECKPDIIHIWGTETCISNAASNCSAEIPKVVFIQGILGVHKRYLGGYFERKQYPEYWKGTPLQGRLRAWLRGKLFIRQAEIEKQTIQNCQNVVIDSEFAEAYCKRIDPQTICHYRTLAPNAIFDEYRWKAEKANRHQIFTVFAGSAEKGVQQLLFAVGLLKEKYEDIQVVIPGNYSLSKDGRLKPGKKVVYEKILSNVIKDLHLEENVRFVGRLNSKQMAQSISSSHIFVNPSCMEVHALSLREAMQMGVPCISTLCGGVGSYVKHRENGLIYRYEEYEVLARYVDELFSNEKLCEKLSSNALKANAEYQKGKNDTLKTIYQRILDNR